MAAVIDLFSRRVVGWSMSATLPDLESTGHPLVRLSALSDRPGFAVRMVPDLKSRPASALRVGVASLAAFGIADAIQPGRYRYDSQLFTLDDPTIISEAGIIILRTGEAIEDTLDHTDPDQDGYRREAGGQVLGDDGLLRQEGGVLFTGKPQRVLSGRYLSLLLGNAHNHYHWLALNLARVALLTRSDIDSLDGVLVPAGLSQSQRAWLTFTGLERLVEVSRGETIKVESLLLPWNVASS